MTPDTAEMAIVDPASELAAAAVGDGLAVGLQRGSGYPVRRDAVGPWARLRADPARMAAVRDTWQALWSSRLVIWAVGIVAVATLGLGRVRHAFHPPHVTEGFGWLGDLLAAPAARWDSAWYLVIAHYGYRPDLGVFTASRSAFFPLYPLGLRTVSELGVQPLLAGVLLSVAALALGLYGIHRLTTLELPRLVRAPDRGGEVARLAVLVTAFAPMALYFSAVYSESLYLALSVGVFWCARQGRWAWAGTLGALAGATRSAGVVLALPIAILYLYGPREDRAPDFPDPRTWWRACAPRYRLRRDVLWLALLPVGVAAYLTYFALDGGSALLPFHAQQVWSRHFAGPYLGVWDGAQAAFEGARQLLSLHRTPVYFKAAGGSSFVSAGHNLMLFAFLLAAVPAVLGVLRRLPLAYGAYVLAALALPLSYPVTPQPLMSLPRFLVVLFPLSMWGAARLAARPRARTPALVASALLMSLFVVEFATWHWVA
jgi:Mannosyltransferase (PIG-V)